MSRIGKQPIAVADKVEVVINGSDVKVKGPKGELTYNFTDYVNITKEDNSIVVTPKDDSNT
ncbi:MAG: 50S ribosomal protein L6, partial [Bdellovibrionota bacterium]|nr:50S ribosomal protein L6 [Bdellovibrionota bacterium]